VGEKHSNNVLFRENTQNAGPTSISYNLSDTQEALSKKPLSQVTKYDIMLRNLVICQDYIKKQNLTLSNINDILGLMRLGNCFDGQESIETKEACNFIYIDTLIHMSKESHSSLLLFGISDDSPVRIHLNLKGKQDVFNLRSLPLLSAPAFSSLIQSGLSRRNPTSQFFDKLMQEVLSLMIKADSSLSAVSLLIKDIKKVATTQSLNSRKVVEPPINNRISFFIKCIHRLTSVR